jgi:hypothetical protein
VPGEVDRLEADLLGVSEPLLVHVADQHGRRAKDTRGRGRRKPNRPCPGDLDGRSDTDLGGDGAVESRGQNIGEAGQIADLAHSLSFVRKRQQIEVGIGHQT